MLENNHRHKIGSRRLRSVLIISVLDGKSSRRQFLDPSVWYAARLAYSRSCAVMSMIGFVLGLGDRHGENILIDVTEGCVVHVDFNLIFHKGEYLPVREVVPFRLTRNMVNGFGPTGVEGSFRRSCESTLRVMRENKDTLLTVSSSALLYIWLVSALIESSPQSRRVEEGNRQAPLPRTSGPQTACSTMCERTGRPWRRKWRTPLIYPPNYCLWNFVCLPV
ncbi:unnamed protein product [Cylicostephanus goldi]|uniref:Serine/threonine-protein kinase ATR n=1 Tax=Cylicostephanus goldi TaxID=71465 RepID=A0A3P6PU45_CYLGO|nr:unnamed protein product [Cylicostephanus goldi]